MEKRVSSSVFYRGGRWFGDAGKVHRSCLSVSGPQQARSLLCNGNWPGQWQVGLLRTLLPHETLWRSAMRPLLPLCQHAGDIPLSESVSTSTSSFFPLQASHNAVPVDSLWLINACWLCTIMSRVLLWKGGGSRHFRNHLKSSAYEGPSM